MLLDAAFCAFFIGALFSVEPPLDVDVSAEFEPDESTNTNTTAPPSADVTPEDKVTVDEQGIRTGVVSFSLFWFVYSTFFLTDWGATPGKRLMGVRIVRSDGSPLDWKVSLIRSLFSVISGNFVMLGYIWGFFSKDRRTWHDRIAGTRAVRAQD